MPDPLDLSDAISNAAQKPAEASGDAGSVKQHSLPDLIAADKYLAQKRAAAAGRGGLALRFVKIVNPGTAE